ncbi:MAG: hypothetical protein P1V20_24300 [Verrucomicrobiales bacterium]|nr:hypothetical protein [Verrucomicrobiales bacterium]
MRRRLLFVVTLITIILVLTGTVVIAPFLEKNLQWFVVFWGVCFLSAMSVIVIALLDMRMIRKEHRKRQTELDAELADIFEEARAKASEDSNAK